MDGFPSVDYSESLRLNHQRPLYQASLLRIDFWQDKLNKGSHHRHRGQQDNHNATIPITPHSAVGIQQLSSTPIISPSEVARRHSLRPCLCRHTGNADRAMEFTADSGQQHFVMGDNLQVCQHRRSTSPYCNCTTNTHPELVMDGARSPLLDMAPLTQQHEIRSFDLQSGWPTSLASNRSSLCRGAAPYRRQSHLLQLLILLVFARTASLRHMYQ